MCVPSTSLHDCCTHMHLHFLSCFITDVVLSYAIDAFESAKFAEGVQVQTTLVLDDQSNVLSHLYISLFLLEVH